MASQPLVLTDSDVRDPNLLLRYLRKASAQITDLMDRLSKVESAPTPLSAAQLQASVQATGSHPINVTGLLGVLAQPQPASATVYTVAPSGQVLQSLRDQQLVAVGTQSTGYALNLVIGGNPNSLYQLISGLAPGTAAGSFMTLDTAQTSTGAKSIALAAGAVGTPALAFSTSTNTGLYTTLIGTFAVAANGTNIMIFSTVGETFTQKIISYNGDTLSTGAGGVPTIVYRNSFLNQGASIGATTIFTPTIAGEYRCSIYINAHTLGTGNVSGSVTFFDGTVGGSFTTGTVSLAGVPLFQQETVSFHQNNSALTISTSYTATGTYDMYVVLERLS